MSQGCVSPEQIQSHGWGVPATILPRWLVTYEFCGWQEEEIRITYSMNRKRVKERTNGMKSTHEWNKKEREQKTVKAEEQQEGLVTLWEENGLLELSRVGQMIIAAFIVSLIYVKNSPGRLYLPLTCQVHFCTCPIHLVTPSNIHSWQFPQYTQNIWTASQIHFPMHWY